jgi:hypothetical protein
MLFFWASREHYHYSWQYMEGLMESQLPAIKSVWAFAPNYCLLLGRSPCNNFRLHQLTVAVNTGADQQQSSTLAVSEP